MPARDPTGTVGDVGHANLVTPITAESIARFFDLPHGSCHITTGQLATLLNMKEESVRRWRVMDPPRGPRFVRWGTQVRFHLDDVVTFLEEGQPSAKRRGPSPKRQPAEQLPSVPLPPVPLPPDFDGALPR